MSEVSNSEELCQAMSESAVRIVLPANANLLLDGARLSAEQIEQLEMVARECGRLVHCC